MTEALRNYDILPINIDEACDDKVAYGLVYETGDINDDLFAFKYTNDSYKILGLEGLIEIDILSRINHPYIIHAIKIITNNNCEINGLAILLPLADGSLYDITKNKYLTTDTKLPILYKLSIALKFLHQSNILHLDIKNKNIVIQYGMKEYIQYFINFEVSMIVDNISIGKYNENLLVTFEYRAPEILEGGRIYNEAVDIWAFGIMLLYTIVGDNIYDVNINENITELKFRDILIDTFPKNLPELLKGVRQKYYSHFIDFFTKILKINPHERLTASEICNHPIFSEFNLSLESNITMGNIIIPEISFDYSDDHRDILKLIFHWGKSLYENSYVELLFLAVDLFNRVGTFYKNYQSNDRMILAATCLWVATKLINDKIISLNIYVNYISETIHNIIPNNILNTEITIIHVLSGILNVSNLYKLCNNGDQLKLSFEHIIMSKDSTLYARTNVTEWIKELEIHIKIPKILTKNITIINFLIY